MREMTNKLTEPKANNQVWFMDLKRDQLEDCKTFRLFNFIDDFNREAIAAEVDFSLPSEWVIRELKQIISWRGKPEVILCDKAPSSCDKAPSSLVRRFKHGRKSGESKSGESGLNTFNLVTHNKTIMLNVSIGWYG